MSDPIGTPPLEAEGTAPGEPDAPSGPRLVPKWIPVVLLALAGAILVGLMVWVMVSGGGPNTYDEQTRQAFMQACTESGASGAESVCGCFYNSIVRTIPYKRYEQVNRQLLTAGAPAGDRPLPLPKDFESLLEACRAAS